jgi:hypothetical protein
MANIHAYFKDYVNKLVTSFGRFLTPIPHLLMPQIVNNGVFRPQMLVFF